MAKTLDLVKSKWGLVATIIIVGFVGAFLGSLPNYQGFLSPVSIQLAFAFMFFYLCYDWFLNFLTTGEYGKKLDKPERAIRMVMLFILLYVVSWTATLAISSSLGIDYCNGWAKNERLCAIDQVNERSATAGEL